MIKQQKFNTNTEKKTKETSQTKKSKLFRFSGKKIVSWHTNNNLWLRKSIKCNWEKVVELIVWTELSLCVRTRRTGLIEIQIGFMSSFRNQIQYYDVSIESVGKQNISMCLLSIFNSVNEKICNQKGRFFRVHSREIAWEREANRQNIIVNKEREMEKEYI